MNGNSAPPLPPSIPAPQPVPQLLRDLVHERLGVYFDDERTGLMLDKLQDRAAARGCASFLDYYYILKYDAHDVMEWRRVMDAFSVQETYFWREFEQIRALVEHVVPAWFKHRSDQLTIWSAACATGEEPYTVAMALREAGWGGHPIRIVASDASDAALEKARRGSYRERSFRALPEHLRIRYFERGQDISVISDDIKAAVDFRWANLVDPPTFADLGHPHVVFCRNVFIYFSAACIQRVVRSFADLIPEGGHLFVGAAESLLKLTSDFDLTEMGGAFVYRKLAEQASVA